MTHTQDYPLAAYDAFQRFHRRGCPSDKDKTADLAYAELLESSDGTDLILHKGILHHDQPIRLTIHLVPETIPDTAQETTQDATPPSNHYAIHIRHDAPETINDAALMMHYARRLLGLNQPIADFEQHIEATDATQHNPPSNLYIRDLVRQQHGLTVPQTTTPFEGLMWAIIGQQINVSFASTLRRRLIELSQIRHRSGLWCFPSCHEIAALSVDQLRAVAFSQSKAETLLRVAHAVKHGDLPLDEWQTHLMTQPHDTKYLAILKSALLALKGIGEWTVNYTLLRGFGLPDCSLHGDAVIKKRIQHYWQLSDLPSPAQAEVLLAPYAPYRSLLAAHLWASQ